MNWEFVGLCAVGAVVLIGWIGAGYAACNRDYQRKKKAARDVELAALDALGKDTSNYRGIDFRA